MAKTKSNTVENLVLDDEVIMRQSVRRISLRDDLVFLFDSNSRRKDDLSCTLLVGGETSDLHLRWMEISRHIYVRCPSHHIVRANQISATILNGTTSPVQRLVFDTEGHVPVSIGCDHPDLMLEVYFPFEVLRALSDDLGGNVPPLIDFAF